MNVMNESPEAISIDMIRTFYMSDNFRGTPDVLSLISRLTTFNSYCHDIGLVTNNIYIVCIYTVGPM